MDALSLANRSGPTLVGADGRSRMGDASYRLSKRVTDVVLAVLLLLLAAVPMALVFLALKLTSRAPAIFRQRRYGLNGREIVIYKFRTMNLCEDGTRMTTARRDDPRVTRLGLFLRRTSLDELPQLVNVLQGSMSLVGPRPLAVCQNERYRKVIRGYMRRHEVKPGITGWAQVHGLRGGDSIEEVRLRLKYDLEYLRSWSFWLDIRILLRTAPLIFRDPRAY